MAVSLSVCRYTAFALFTLCNAVICCLGVWNLLLAQQLGLQPLADIYLIATSAFGILFIFPVMFIDLLRKNALVSRVWFESLWVGLFWILNLAGASLATATLPRLLCSFPADLLTPDSCITTRVVEGFAWAGTAILLAYFALLMVCAIIHTKDDSQVWGANTRTYPWFKTREALHSAPSSPMRTTWSKPLALGTPQIRLPSEKQPRTGTLRSAAIKSSALRSSTMKSSALRTSTFDSERMTRTPATLAPSGTPATLEPIGTPLRSSRSANKSAKILQSAWMSATVTPASPPSDEYGSSSSGSGSGSSPDLTSTPTGIPPSAMYVPFSSTIKPSPLGPGAPLRSAAPPRSASLYGGQQPPLSAVASSKLATAFPVPSPHAQLSRQGSNASTSSNSSRKSKRRSNRPPPLDMTRLHSTYGR